MCPAGRPLLSPLTFGGDASGSKVSSRQGNNDPRIPEGNVPSPWQICADPPGPPSSDRVPPGRVCSVWLQLGGGSVLLRRSHQPRRRCCRCVQLAKGSCSCPSGGGGGHRGGGGGTEVRGVKGGEVAPAPQSQSCSNSFASQGCCST